MVHQIVDAFKKMNFPGEVEPLESEEFLYRRLINCLDMFIGDLLINGDAVHADGFRKLHHEIFVFLLNATYLISTFNLEVDDPSMYELLYSVYIGRLYRMGKTEAANELIKMKEKLIEAATKVAFENKKYVGQLIKDKGLGQYVFLACFISNDDE